MFPNGLKRGESLPEILLPSLKETQMFARLLARILQPNDVICFWGDLAAGKTTMIKAAAFALGYRGEVTSPTFTYLHIYQGHFPIHHFDCYRLAAPDDFLEKGFEEFFHAKGVCLLEWPEKIVPLLPPQRIDVHIEHAKEGRCARLDFL